MLKAIDFFCGAGGLTRGLLDAGIDVLAGVDIDDRLQKTYEHNNAPSKFLNLDIKKVDIRSLRSKLGVRASDKVMYAACTPCQPFSTLNQRQGRDSRKSLLLAFAKLVEVAPPHLIVVENVPGLNTAYGKNIYRRFIGTLERAGFKYRFESMLDAQHYGVPQVRKRFIMIASRVGAVPAPRRSHDIKTVAMAIGHLPHLEAGERDPKVDDHWSRKLMAHHSKLLAHVPANGGSRHQVKDESLLLPCHRGNPKIHKDVFGRMQWDAPAPTLTCRCTDIYCGRFAHPEQNRGISVREAALLQSFPPDYRFVADSVHSKAAQIGNAVPVELARRLGRAALRSLRSIA